MAKGILLVADGLGDRPLKELGGKTPLEAADIPNIDRSAPARTRPTFPFWAMIPTYITPAEAPLRRRASAWT